MTESTRKGFRLNLYLDKSNGWTAGVCAGIARRTSLDVAVVRVVAIIAALFLPKLTIAAYLIAWLVLDDRLKR